MPGVQNQLEPRAKTYIIPADKNLTIQKKTNFNNAPLCGIDIEMNTNSAFVRWNTDDSFW